ncbi:SDR family NAD(P)-dependent oxidoreductase [Paenibacillus sp. Y412MC10]|uniref:SDR family NAD(P)-dependent oxidoreductase n=1 Tax=Geobacillus sp. (strain Y412MC10) TaxID=481743 RepID=UPI001642847B|nr:SDR family NAD(P)-dependent oxidoreductase [Paenibacillus sp. Y412MC10]
MSRPTQGDGSGKAAPSADILQLTPFYQETDFQANEVQEADAAYTQHILFLCGLEPHFLDLCRSRLPEAQQIILACSRSERPDLDLMENADHMLLALQEAMKDRGIGKVLVQLVIHSAEQRKLQTGLYAFLSTARQENPRIVPQLIEIGEGVNETAFVHWIMEAKSTGSCERLRIQFESVSRFGWREEKMEERGAVTPWKDGGVYLITGGMGGLGRQFAADICRKASRPVVILSGRAPLDAKKEEQLAFLSSIGANVEYIQADIADKDQVDDLVLLLIRKYGVLNGIIHCAGVIQDGYILRKTVKEMHRVLSPKVTGLTFLDQATQGVALDFLVLCSSIAGSLGNPGQADYALANAYMDAYAAYRNRLVAEGLRFGRTISINWPLWKDGGMEVANHTEDGRNGNQGLTAMDTSDGLEVLYFGIATKHDQIMTLSGDIERWRHELLGAAESSRLSESTSSLAQTAASLTHLNSDMLKERTAEQLKELFGKTIQVPSSRISLHEPLESYGLDSLIVNQMNRQLEEIFGDLSKTLFYEYMTLGEVADYLSSAHTDACVRWSGYENESVQETTAPEEQAHSVFPTLVSRRKNRQAASTLPATVQTDRPERQEKPANEPIAIIGISGRYPQADDVQQFWDNLMAGKDCITEVPEERWPLNGFYTPDPETAVESGMSYSKWGGFLEGFTEFDPLFFNISPKEAMMMDPQERLFLQACWHALEDAGYTRELLAVRHRRRVGVYAGVTKTGHDLYGPEVRDKGDNAHPYTSFSSVANRVSYFLNVNGPSMPVDTMCSSSLTAIHEACEHLRRDECEVAIAGGVNLYLHPSSYTLLSAQNMLSADGKCRSFGEGANGFVPGEGVGVVILKPLSTAVRDRDNIHTVIRSTSINHGGKTNGYTVPSPKAQGDLIRAALDKAGVDARTITYLEAHGTGTELGDPIEITGLTQAFAVDTQDTGFCAIGSAKSNIGHLEAAAGIAGLTKIVLQMKHRTLVPSLHVSRLNPNISFQKTPFKVQQHMEDWQRPMIQEEGKKHVYPRRAGISSFGAGGSNAHAILEEYLPEEPGITRLSPKQRKQSIIVISAKNEAGLKMRAQQLLKAVHGKFALEADIGDIAYTLQVGREAMEERLAFLAGSMEDLRFTLEQFVSDQPRSLQDGPFRGTVMGVAQVEVQTELDRNIEAWVRDEQFRPVAELWVQGAALDWERLYVDMKPSRISLPGYPFAKERYFIRDQVRRTPIVNKESSAVTMKSTMAQPSTGKGRRAEMLGLQAVQCLELDVKEQISGILHLPVERLNLSANLADFGFDSISLSQLAARLSGLLGIDLSPSVFFGHSTIEKLLHYMSREFRDVIADFYSETSAAEGVQPVPTRLRTTAVNTDAKGLPRASLSSSEEHPEPVAIIGISGRFPGARDIEEMWSVLAGGRIEVSEIPEDRFDWRSYYSDSGSAAGSMDSKWLGSLPGVREFDPLFFDIAPKDAETMDPRQRLLLQEAWKALEHAGYGDAQIKQGRIGMFVGAEQGDYQQLLHEQGITSNHNAILAARLSYFLDLKGPVLTVDTACSSGLAAAHQACLSLRSGECDTAIAAGVNLMLTPAPYLAMSKAGMLSKDGKCLTFDKRANGLVPGEAVAVVVLKRLSKAEEDGDPILGIIRGSGINYDGRTNGITAPSAVAQTELIQSVYDQAGIQPEHIEYIVSHGTGTKLGDPVEVGALQEAFRRYTDQKGFCVISSNKPHFGHTFAASGLVNLIHLVQAFHHELIPGSTYLEQGNDFIQWENSPVYVSRESVPWPETESGRLGAVSAFGMSGTNVHMVVQSYASCPEPETGVEPSHFLFALSAKTKEALETKARELAEWLQKDSFTEQNLVNVCYTLLTGRQHFQHRMAVVARNVQEAIFLLSGSGGRDKQANRFTGKVAVDFVGQSMIGQYASDLTRRAAEQEEPADTYKEILLALADLYCQGYSVEGTTLYTGCFPRRIELPSYPFEREQYWAAHQKSMPTTQWQGRLSVQPQSVTPQTESIGGAHEIAESEYRSSPLPEESEVLMSFEEVWVREDLPHDGSLSWKPRTLICFLNEDHQKQQILAMVREQNPATRVMFISRHTPETGLSEDEHTLTVTDPKAYADALANVKERFSEVDAVLYMWAMKNPALSSDYASIVHIIQAMASARLKPKQLLLAGRYSNLLERCHLESWIGFERSLGQVMQGIQVTTAIFAADSGHEEAPLAWFRHIWDELGAGLGQSVLYEGGDRRVCRVHPVADQELSTDERGVSSWVREGGTYLITGGCGGLGLQFAKHAAARHPVNLILTGRSTLEPAKQSEIDALEALGCSVYYLQANLCNIEAMRNGLDEARRRFGKINGVLHAAGISDGRNILQKDAEAFLQVLAPKISGTLILDELLQSDPPEFVCYFGSSSSVLGDFGACDYAVGNRFELAYAQHRADSVIGKTRIINWPLWKEGGMGFHDPDSTDMYLRTSGLRLLETGEGLDAFDRILASKQTQVLLLPGRPSRVRRFLGISGSEGDQIQETQTASNATVQVPPDSPGGKGRKKEMKGWSIEQCLEWDIKERIVEQLHIPAHHLDSDENWADFGFDSIHLAQFATRLSEYYGLDISPSIFFGQSTIAKLTGYFMDEYEKPMLSFYAEGLDSAAEAAKANEEQILLVSGIREPAEDLSSRPAAPPSPIQAPAAGQAEITRPRVSELSHSLSEATGDRTEPVAIIGMSGRFPGARTIDDMWTILSEGKSAVSEVPLDRFDWQHHTREAEAAGDKVFCRWSGTIPGVGEFDPLFFEISPKEAEWIDPRQRLLLQEAWRALEDAGYGEERLKSSTIGMFVGVEEGDYHLLTKEQGSITSNHNAILAARLSYVLNLSGPNMAINTACSSGLVAVHQACMSLRNGECDTAVAAGVNLMLTPDAYDGISHAGILSEDGTCYAFDQRANGTVPGEAVAVIVLKRLSKAVADRDPIYAVIRGSGVNYDGKTNGITAPSETAQARLIRDVYRQYHIDPERIEYIVTHGTGTKLGDPVEINALNEAFRTFTGKRRYCAVTSAKTNFGHAFAASGLVSLVNLVMAMRHGVIPASLNFERENEYIRWDDSPFYVNGVRRTWDVSGESTRVGAVSAFGMSGTNAHMVVESYPDAANRATAGNPPYYLLLLSAKTKEALRTRAEDLTEYLAAGDRSDEELKEISYTLLQGRQHFQYRSAVVIRDLSDAQNVLRQSLQGMNSPHYVEGRVSRQFTAQRALNQYVDELMRRSQGQRGDAQTYRDTLLALADLYCQGYSLDGDRLFGEEPPGFVHLPTYPFAREYYWVKPVQGQEDAASANVISIREKMDKELSSREDREPTLPKDGLISNDVRLQSDRVGQMRTNGRHDETTALAAAAVGHLRTIVAEVTGVPYDRLEDEASFEEIGLDSLMITGLNAKVEQWIGTLESTLFYQYNNIQQLADYLAVHHKEAVECLLPDVSEPLPNHAPAPKDRKMAKQASLVEETVPAPSHRESQDSATKNEAGPDTGAISGLNLSPNGGQNGAVDIAIVGLAGRYPLADTLDQFWSNLYEGKDCIEEIPAKRWPLKGFYEPDRTKAVANGLSYSKWGGFLDRIEYFDPLFFNISPRDAMYMDPQERLFLETAWACVEDAGYTRESLRQDGYGNQIGVFVGATFNNYQLYMADAANKANQEEYLATSQMFSIANRVSYVMNFTGPSLTVDTACSSSLYAVHLACESIRNGQSRLAIAGGVNLSLHPSKYVTLCQGQFNASDGRCRAFAEGGTGYVPSEAVGAVLLKPLDEAIRDHDQIYGVIKGTAVSHAGKTNGYTVPSPVSQSQAIDKALGQSGIHPRTISCIEAHGTGTALGDPIEVKGLTDVFTRYTDAKGYCSISSVKSNIGHAEAAAGIAQLTKVLLQMKHRTLVRNVMHAGLNPNIDFGRTPFTVQTATAPWERPVIDGREYPRRSGISSFGAGGANAHVIVEEYTTDPQDHHNDNGTVNRILILLSAKNEDRLKAQAERLLSSIRRGLWSDEQLPDLAYTLQVGREAMEERLGLIVQSLEELEKKLDAFMEGRGLGKNYVRGQAKRNKEIVSVIEADADFHETVLKWMERDKYDQLLGLWVKGLNVDWSLLYGERKPFRISLPTYPFAGEPYWVPEIQNSSAPRDDQAASSGPRSAGLHPLLHRNTSDISGVRFSSTFDGTEFFLADHVVKGKPFLPGVAYLEMAIQAVTLATPEAGVQHRHPDIRLKNVVWARPIAIDGTPVEVHVDLLQDEHGEIAYEVYTVQHQADDQAEMTLHSQGSATVGSRGERPAIDLQKARSRCRPDPIPSEELYALYGSMGIQYGPAHQGIRGIWTGDGQVVAEIALPDALAGTEADFLLHPSLLDSVLQATLGFVMGPDRRAEGETKPGLPFALQELEVYGRCPEAVWAVIRFSEDHKPNSPVQRVDIDVCDEIGTVMVRMKGFSTRVLEAASAVKGPEDDAGVLLFEPIYSESPAPLYGEMPSYASRIVFLCHLEEASAILINSKESALPTRFVALNMAAGNMAERYASYVEAVFTEIRSVLRQKPKDRVLVQVVMPTREEHRYLAGLGGLLKAAQSESSKLVGQVIELDRIDSGLINRLDECAKCPGDSRIRYADGKRWTAGWSELAGKSDRLALPWKDHGVYLITGGTGALGLMFAREIASRVQSPTLILTGRSPQSAAVERAMRDLSDAGAQVIYKQADVADHEQTVDLLRWAAERHGTINGIIHAAGIIRDNLIVNKEVDELQGVLSAKVAGLVNLDEASRDQPLDVLIAFSSVAGATGNPGQADYSAANAFMDAYAAYRNHLTQAGQRHGRMLSVNWPLWKEGGMSVEEDVVKIMRKTLGTWPMETGDGIRALYQGLAAGADQVVAMAGLGSKIRARMLPLNPLPSGVQVQDADMPSRETGADTLEQIYTVLREGVSHLLKVKEEDIDADSEFSDYGFDSISLTQLANLLNEKYPLELTPTLFFEYTTLGSFAEYLLDRHADAFSDRAAPETNQSAAHVSSNVRFADDEDSEETLPNAAEHTIPVKQPRGGYPRRSRAPLSGKSVTDSGHDDLTGPPETPVVMTIPEPEPVAIVGVSGVFPGAKNIHEFWRNIINGNSAISEIPSDRWDWRDYAGESTAEGTVTSLKWGGFIDGVKDFDPLFFGISPREAELMDPQQRLLLMEAWRAVEDAGIAVQRLSDHSTGVFVAAGPGDYMSMTGIEQGNPQAMTGVVPSLIPNRISYALNLHGPSEYYETACSSTLVALHRAVRSIQGGECDQAIVGAVNLLISPDPFVGFDSMGYLSSEGRTSSFQPDASGFVRSEGVGAVMLKPLSRAIADRHEIYAVIRGTGISHGGKGMSLTSPNAQGMKTAMKQAFRQSGIDPRTVSYIEAHGIASPMADGVEIHSLKTGYLEMAEDISSKPWNDPCYVGSLKPLIGHCEVASGMASLIKVLCAFRHKVIPGIHGFTEPSGQISLNGSPLRLTSEHLTWSALTDAEGRELPRRAALNSFGIGGVNGHILLEEYTSQHTEAAQEHPSNRKHLFALSARNGDRLKAYARQMLEYVEGMERLPLADMAFTLQLGREAMHSRLALIAGTREELHAGLSAFLQDGKMTGSTGSCAVSIAVGSAESPPKDVTEQDVAEWIAAENIQKLAAYWVQGVRVPWEQLYQGSKQRRIPLPTYPFEARRCWSEVPMSRRDAEGTAKMNNLAWDETEAAAAAIQAGKRITGVVSALLGMDPEEMNPDLPLDQYGLDSILFMQLLQRLQQHVDPGIDLSSLQGCHTLKDLIRIVPPSVVQTQRDNPMDGEQRVTGEVRTWPAFPELILLNAGLRTLRPVFWFHGGLGGVEMYQDLSRQSDRPFYGIQARGWMSERAPLQGVAAMAAYYVHMILSVQPEGPYDLGGYSLGGVLAYEVARQLQELEHKVNTVVMLDSPYGEAFQQGEISRPTAVLQAVNLALASNQFQRPDTFAETLIHRDELELASDEEGLLRQLIQLGYGRGLTKTEQQIRAMIDANIKMQHAYQFDRFSVKPLSNASEITCYYFRNKRGLIFGELEPYFSIHEDTTPLDQAAYWEEWERQFPNIHMIDIDPSNHMVLLSEPQSYEKIYEFCARLYSKEGASEAFLNDFKRRTANAISG